MATLLSYNYEGLGVRNGFCPGMGAEKRFGRLWL
jgi:hypothetical protein